MISRSAAWNWAAVLVAAIVSFSLTPFLVHAFGNLYYGVWVLAWSALTYYGMFDFGISTSVQRYVALYTSRSDQPSANDTLRAAIAFTGAVGVLALLGTLAVCVCCYIRLPHTLVNKTLFGTVLPLLAASVAASFPTRPMGAYLRGVQRFDLTNAITIGSILMRGAAAVVIIRLGFGIASVALGTLAISILSVLAYGTVLWRLDPSIYSLVLPSWSRIRDLFQFTFFVFLTTVGDYFRFNLDLLVVARWVGLALVTPYSIAGSLVAYFSTTMGGISGPLMTELVSRHTTPPRERDFFLRATKVTMSAALLCVVFALADGRQFLRAWMGESFAFVYPVLAVLTVANAVDLGQNISMHYLYSHSRHRLMGYWTLAEGVLNLALSISLAQKYGILGVAVGTAIPMLLVKVILQPWYTLREAKISIRQYISHSILVPVLIATFVFVVSSKWNLTAPTVICVAANILWQSLLFAALFYRFALASSERAIARMPVMKMLHHLRILAPLEQV